MRHDYLWDKSGPPDPEIARLEQSLSALRQPQGRPAWLQEFAAEQEPSAVAPNVAPFVPRQRWWQVFQMPQVAFATVALCTLAGGLWFGWTRNPQPESAPRVATASATPQPEAAPVTLAPTEGNGTKPRAVVVRASRRVAAARTLPVRVQAVRPTATPPKIVRQPAPRPQDEVTPEEARKVQADLALALRVINDKLNLAQKSIEGRTLKIPELAGDGR